MKLIIEKDIDGIVYCYQETEKHFKSVEKERSDSLTKLPAKVLDNECNLDSVMEGSYFVFDIR